MNRKCLLFLLVAFPMSMFSQQLDIFFDFDKFSLNAQAMQTLNQWAGEHRNVQVNKIYGYCDHKGTSAYNDSLSIQRIDEVHKFLTNSGIRIIPDYEMIGFGKDFHQTDQQWQNRKVTIFYSELPQNPDAVAQTSRLEEKLKSSKVGDKITLDNIIFHNMSARVIDNSLDELYTLLCIMQENPNLKIEIQGHICCQTRNDTDLTTISTQRARTIYNYLLRNKIARSRLSFKGYGVSNPIYPIPEKSEAERNANRRVEILILEN